MTIVKDHNRDAMARMYQYDKPVLGLTEFAAILGVTKQTLSNRRARGKLPSPTQELAMGPVWGNVVIVNWLRTDP